MIATICGCERKSFQAAKRKHEEEEEAKLRDYTEQREVEKERLEQELEELKDKQVSSGVASGGGGGGGGGAGGWWGGVGGGGGGGGAGGYA